jgi:hypothetical protein
MRRLPAALAALALAATGLAAQAATVPLDHAVRLSLSGPAAEVVVGSPKFLDVTVVDPRTVLVHGKELGVTNLIIYDQAGRTVFNERVAVVAPSGEAVSIYRGAETTDFVCNGACRPSQPVARNPWLEVMEAAQVVSSRARDASVSAAATTTPKQP